ncbi:MAG: AI-2E family transporter [Bacteroidales bacterium]|nr:AI-2E family transporter [Bacteroidales bacterium]
MSTERRPYTFDRVVRILFSVCAVLAVLYLLNLLKGVLLPFLVACLIAYALEPLVSLNKRLLHSRGRFLPVMFTLIEVTIFFGSAAWILIPYIIQEAETMVTLLKRYVDSTVVTPYLPSEIHEFLRQNLNIDTIQNLLSQAQWREFIKSAVSSSWNFLSSSLSFLFGVLSWGIVFLYVIFIMIDYEKLILSFRQLLPHSHRGRIMGIVTDVKNAMNCYFRGQALIAFIVGCLFAIGFLIIGLPMGLILGLFIGLLNMVPYLQLISLPITALLCLVCSVDGNVDFWVIFWESMAVYVVVQCIQDLYLTPKIMGKAMGLNPAIILLSLSIWGSLLGFLGLIIALPLTTLVLSYYDKYVVQPYKNTKTGNSPLDTPFS